MPPKVVDTEYYDLLEVQTDATQIDIKKAYRKLAITHHPDKNPGDESAHQKFQAISEAYQVLSQPELRQRYDKLGKESAVPDTGFEDPAEFFGMIFGGDAFVDLIGQISLMTDLTKTMDIAMKEQEAAEAEAAATGTMEGAAAPANVEPGKVPTEPVPAQPTVHEAFEEKLHVSEPSPSVSGTSTPRRGVPVRHALMDRSDEDVRLEAGMTAEEEELRRAEKRKGGLSKEQRDELLALEEERKRVRNDRVGKLAEKLVNRVNVWTESDKHPDQRRAFEEQTRLEAENLKMESFGIEILHAIGTTYLQKATSFLKSQKFLGISGFFSRLKDKGTLAKETWGTISSVLDAQMTIEEMAKLEEMGGEEWTGEKKMEFERRVTGKILAAAWRGSKLEIQSVLRDVCDKLLNDKSVSLSKRTERAEALVMVGTIFQRTQRDPDDDTGNMVFEQLMAEAAAKKERVKFAKKPEKKEETPEPVEKS